MLGICALLPCRSSCESVSGEGYGKCINAYSRMRHGCWHGLVQARSRDDGFREGSQLDADLFGSLWTAAHVRPAWPLHAVNPLGAACLPAMTCRMVCQILKGVVRHTRRQQPFKMPCTQPSKCSPVCALHSRRVTVTACLRRVGETWRQARALCRTALRRSQKPMQLLWIAKLMKQLRCALCFGMRACASSWRVHWVVSVWQATEVALAKVAHNVNE